MAYYLTIKKGKINLPIEIDNLKQFQRTSRFRRGTYSLEEIDHFSSSFYNAEELQKELYLHHLIDIDDFGKEISIRYKKNDELEKVRYGLIYNENVKYLDLNYLRYSLLSKQNDFEFLKSFTRYYRNSYANCGVINQLMIIAETKNYNHQNIEYLLNEFIENELFQWNKVKHTQKLKYKSLHDLAAFMINYDSKQEKKQNEYTQINEKTKEINEEQFTPKEIDDLTKQKKKSLTPIDGQLSLF